MLRLKTSSHPAGIEPARHAHNGRFPKPAKDSALGLVGYLFWFLLRSEG
jgi:hypothetical protein